MTPELTLAQVLEATSGRGTWSDPVVPPSTFTGVSIDSRTVAAGQLFVAISGPRFDGHDFLAAAAAAGAGAALVERARPESPLPQVVVASTAAALAALGAARRRESQVRVVGVTGSVGKTTTKELLAAILAQVAPTLFTEGNLNNELGLPLTLLRLRPEHRFAVIEMGMSAPGEIDRLAALADPEVGIITCLAPAHLESMGSLEAIADAKAELFARIPAAGAIVYPSSDARLRERAARSPARHISFGETPSDGVQVLSIKLAGQGSVMNVRFGGGGERCVGVPLLGRHNAWNAAAAAAAAFSLGLHPDVIAQGLSYARPARRRSEVKQLAGRRVLDDCYNANPVSMTAALDTLAEVRRSAGAVAVLGDMLELGPDSESFHAEAGRHAASIGLTALVAFGPRSRALAAAARADGLEAVHQTESPEEAARLVLTLSQPGDWVLLKASRGTALERVLEEMKRQSAADVELPAAAAGGKVS